MRIYRDTDRHEIRDVTVSTSLRGDFADAHLLGDQAKVLPTDSQKNTCFAYAKEKGIGEVEDYALDLARHFVDDVASVSGARIEVEDLAWERITVDGREHDHSWVRKGQEVRTTVVTVDGTGEDQRAWVVSGLKDLTLLKSTGSEFAGFLKDRYTTLAETHDRVMATSLVARWRYGRLDVDWGKAYDDVRAILLRTFATVHSLALQQTLWEMGQARADGAPGDRRDPVLGAQQAPLPRRPRAVRPGQPRRGVHRRRPSLRPDRVQRRPGRRRRTPGWPGTPCPASPDRAPVCSHPA